MIDWKELALTLYIRQHGRRCVICSKPVEEKDAHIEELKFKSLTQLSGKDIHYCLMHQGCLDNENSHSNTQLPFLEKQ